MMDVCIQPSNHFMLTEGYAVMYFTPSPKTAPPSVWKEALFIFIWSVRPP